MAKKSNPLSEQLRKAVATSGLSRYRISQETGIAESTLCLFVRGERGLSLESIDALGEFLELEIIMRRKPEKKGK